MPREHFDRPKNPQVQDATPGASCQRRWFFGVCLAEKKKCAKTPFLLDKQDFLGLLFSPAKDLALWAGKSLVHGEGVRPPPAPLRGVPAPHYPAGGWTMIRIEISPIFVSYYYCYYFLIFSQNRPKYGHFYISIMENWNTVIFSHFSCGFCTGCGGNFHGSDRPVLCQKNTGHLCVEIHWSPCTVWTKMK